MNQNGLAIRFATMLTALLALTGCLQPLAGSPVPTSPAMPTLSLTEQLGTAIAVVQTATAQAATPTAVSPSTPTEMALITPTPILTPTWTPRPTLALPPTTLPAPTPLPKLTAISTPNPVRAFAEPILAAIADRPPDYEDDFSDPGSGWRIGSTEGGAWGYEEGEYFIFSATQDFDGTSRSDRAPWLSDFVLEIDGRFVSGEDGNWSVIFRNTPGIPEQAPQGSYGVVFYFEGEVTMFKVVDGVGTELVSEHSLAVHRGDETNHLQVIAWGPRLAVYVNGTPLAFVYDEATSSGAIELRSRTGTAAPLRAHFDNLRIWDIADLALPSAEMVSTSTPPQASAGQCRLAYEWEHDIYVRHCDGTNARLLTNYPAEHSCPSWSPDGQLIVFQSNRDGRLMPNGVWASSIYVVNADTTHLTRLTSGDDDLHPAWSPDGSRVAFQRNCNLVTVNPDGSNLTVILWASDEVCVVHPAWSPDSQRLAFASNRPESEPYTTVYVIDLAGTKLIKLARFQSLDPRPAWSPDGQQIGVRVYAGDGVTKYYLLNADGSGEPAEVASIPDSWYPWYWPQWGQTPGQGEGTQ